MNSKEIFVHIWDRESQTTLRIFRAFPAGRLGVKPHERSRSIRDLAWQCVIDERIIGKIVDGANDLRNVPPSPPPPDAMEEIIAAYEAAHAESLEKVERLSDAEFSRSVTVQTPRGPWQSEQPLTLWGNVLDQVHHRGQLSIYLRIAGGKVPSIYGPSGDEAWLP